MVSESFVPVYRLPPNALLEAINRKTGSYTPPRELEESSKYKYTPKSLLLLVIKLYKRLLKVLTAGSAAHVFAKDHADALGWFTRQVARSDVIAEDHAGSLKLWHGIAVQEILDGAALKRLPSDQRVSFSAALQASTDAVAKAMSTSAPPAALMPLAAASAAPSDRAAATAAMEAAEATANASKARPHSPPRRQHHLVAASES